MQDPELEVAKERYRTFIAACENLDHGGYALIPGDPPSAFASCFALFGLWLVGAHDEIGMRRENYATLLQNNLSRYRAERDMVAVLAKDKPYLQLLTFTLSALHILGVPSNRAMERHVLEVLPRDIAADLDVSGALEGKARSGNTAMFWAILMLHARDWLGSDISDGLSAWINAHLNAMNANGFWGASRSMTHLQFQNGYHQYEIFEYLGVTPPRLDRARAAVASLADFEGHFAPYPGGGGCYDFDAVHILTFGDGCVSPEISALLRRVRATILSEQNEDGGFGESQRVRPRSLANVWRCARHVARAHGAARLERLRYCLTLQRPKHDLIHTHWSVRGRRWGQSNLWDSWFRMLTLARIDVHQDSRRIAHWGFINFPGIGFHRKLRENGIVSHE